ncbi:MAG: CHRD domain-containing protein [Candidatus Krumholzibacteriia bacterium]
MSSNALKSVGLSLAVVLALCALARPAAGDTTFIAMIDGAQNVDPLPVPGTGSAVMVLNTAETELSFDIQYQDLIGVETAAHFHNGGPRENGPAKFLLPMGTPKTGVWNIPPEMVPELYAGRIYINIHTDVYITGELRGNVAQSVPTENTTWGRVKHLFSVELPRN